MLRWIEVLRQTLGARLNRRRDIRRPYKVAIEVRTASGDIYRGVSRDLSRSGMGAIASAPLNIGDHVLIKYEHPTLGKQSTHAVVRAAAVRARLGYRFGFEFDVPFEL